MSINLSQKEINSVINALLHIKNYHDVPDIGETIRKFEQHKQSSEQKHRKIKACAYPLLMECVSDDYAHRILNVIETDIIEDVDECADPVDWNEDDVRLAIGRALVNKLESNDTEKKNYENY